MESQKMSVDGFFAAGLLDAAARDAKRSSSSPNKSTAGRDAWARAVVAWLLLVAATLAAEAGGG